MGSIRIQGSPQQSQQNIGSNDNTAKIENPNSAFDLYIDESTAQKFSQFLGSNNLIAAAPIALHNANNNNVA